MKSWTHSVVSDDGMFANWGCGRCGAGHDALPTVRATFDEKTGKYRMAERFPWAIPTYGVEISVVDAVPRAEVEGGACSRCCPCGGLDPEVHEAAANHLRECQRKIRVLADARGLPRWEALTILRESGWDLNLSLQPVEAT